MDAIYGNIYHQYTPNVSIYTSTMDPMGQIVPSIYSVPRRAELLYGGLRGVPHHGRHGSVHLVPSCTLAAAAENGNENGRVETRGGRYNCIPDVL
jgi:hypothetical protein